MTLGLLSGVLAVIAALLLEQWRAFPAQGACYRTYGRYLDWIFAWTQQSASAHYLRARGWHGGLGLLIWGLAVGGPIALLGVLLGIAHRYSPLLAWVLGVGVLYTLMGFRQFSTDLTAIVKALRVGDLVSARQNAAHWVRDDIRHRQGDKVDTNATDSAYFVPPVDHFDRRSFTPALDFPVMDDAYDTDPAGQGWDHPAIARFAIEQGLVRSYRHVFAPSFWFLLLGPLGALVYRCTHLAALRWAWSMRMAQPLSATVESDTQAAAPAVYDPSPMATPAFTDNPSAAGLAAQLACGVWAQRILGALDWLPVRLTAISFALVGNFQDAVECWRKQSSAWRAPPPSGIAAGALAIVLAAGAGAIGVRLRESPAFDAPPLGGDIPADVEMITQGIGMVWRSLILWAALLGFAWILLL